LLVNIDCFYTRYKIANTGSMILSVFHSRPSEERRTTYYVPPFSVSKNYTSKYIERKKPTKRYRLLRCSTFFHATQNYSRMQRRPSGSAEVLRAAAVPPLEWVRSHINVKEAFALYEVLRPLVNYCSDFLRASPIMMDVDIKMMFHDV